MNIRFADVLEFDTIREVLASWAETEPGRAKCLSLTPQAELRLVASSLEETSEAKLLGERGDQASLSSLPEIGGELDQLGITGRALTVDGLCRLARFAAVAAAARASLAHQDADAPLLAARASELPKLDAIEREIGRAIDVEAEEVRDDASAELARIRAQARRLASRLDKLLDATLHARDTSKLLQETLTTTRNGRPVVPVKAECRSQFPGIVHGSSASGATVFVEPMATVPLNNEIAVLRDRETDEIRRILHALTDRIRDERGALLSAADILSELDLVQARARMSEALSGHAPSLAPELELRLNDARHPLLVRKIAERAGLRASTDPVPISLSLHPDQRGLVLTGPNTGGKTVALKTVGLLALMVQSGLHVPASSTSVFPVFQSVFADIGDEQSIGSSLSTFSSHLAKVVEMEREMVSPALVVLDEVGTGTDPSEGGALGTALVEHFLGRGAMVLASTHHGLLKAYALTTPGVKAASFEFDPETYAPTYHLVEDAAGRSLAFEMAERLGLSAEIVRRARQLQSEREKQVGELVQRLEADTAEVERERARLEEERRAVRAARARLEAEEDEERRERSRRLTRLRESLEADLTETRRELKSLVEGARAALAEVRASGEESRKRLTKLDRELSERLEAVVAPLAEKIRTEPSERGRDDASPESLQPGGRVLVASFGVEGEVLRVQGEEAEVLVHDKKLRLPVSSLELLSAAPVPSRRPVSRGTTSGPSAKEVPSEINLVGMTVDEALGQADKFLDDALLSEYRQVRLIHGHGTGRLRNALRAWLSEHPQVERHASENRDGATVVELKD